MKIKIRKALGLAVGMLVNLLLPAFTLLIFLGFINGQEDGGDDRSSGYAVIMLPFMYIIFSVVPLLIYFYLSEKRRVCFRELLFYLGGLGCVPGIFIAGFIGYETTFSAAIFSFTLTIVCVLYVTIPGTIALRLIYRKGSLGWSEIA